MITFIKILIIIDFIFAVSFNIIYGFLSPWHRYPVGRHLMSYGAVVTVLLAFQVWGIFIGTITLPFWVLGMGALAVVQLWRLWLVIKAQRAGRSNKIDQAK
jgi:hypothetical protein